MKCVNCSEKLATIGQLFHHFILDHPIDSSVICGFDQCTKDFKSISSFRNHFYRNHSGSSLSLNVLKRNLNANSFFYRFFHPQSDNIIPNQPFFQPDISIEVPQNISIADNLSLPNSIEIHDYSLIRKLSEIAFKYFYAVPFCKSNLLNFFSEVLKFIAENNVSNEVITYASEVFLNESRIKKYFIDNFVIFDLLIH